MNMIQFSIASLRFRALGNIFNVIVLALGVALIVMLLQVSDQLERRFDSDLEGIDLVVGAKGSPLQLILSSVFHVDSPTGNIPLEEANKLKENPLVKSSIPLALGDSFKGFRIVGTSPDYATHYHATLAEGVFWQKPMEAVMGSEVARISKSKLGDSFSGSHGLSEGGEAHEASPYKITGILAPTGTVIDRLVLTDVGSVWEVHQHHDDHADKDTHADKDKHEKAKGNSDKSDDAADSKHHDDDEERAADKKELTALLISYKTSLAAASLPRLVNQNTSLQAASPAFEMARMLALLGTGGEVARLFAYALMSIAAVGSFISLLGAVNERQYDMALLRTLGMTRKRLFSFVIMQGLVLGAVGAALGLVFGHIFSGFAMHWIEATRHISLTGGGVHAYELSIAFGAIVLSACAAFVPALMAYRMNVATVLSRRN